MLVVGYGNTLRSDDGAGIRAAELIASRHPATDCITVHELHPELADALAGHDVVVFLDASVRVREVTATTLDPSDQSDPTDTHAHSPQSLLNLCWTLYGKKPILCTLIEIPAVILDFGEELSPTTREAVSHAVEIAGTLMKP